LEIHQPVGARTTTFADLLKRIHDEVPAIQRLRFVTSFPRDFGDDALAVMADSPRICRYLHVPAQSGSNRILKLMNRGYTVEQYVDFIDRARGFMPDVCIAGDFIVGFPTETEEDFQASVSLLRRAGFKNNFVFKYSPRPGTVAIDRFTDDVPEPVKRRRNNELLAVQNEVGERVHRQWVGRTVDVFVQRAHDGQPGGSKAAGGKVELGWERNGTGNGQVHQAAEARTPRMTGRTGGDLIVSFDLPAGYEAGGMVGNVVPVAVTGSGPLLLTGTMAGS
jgi:tRNA-2-methylthio-N6-dimethylallyladenosine synthase